ncbi:hypothetical protein DEU56DRAFT_754114 [Suillus clintonianus]|uniref:uncharacterized protein n=1 Tax=Suillus clintonianus TaxID=1904413 RepID=UPI001B860DFC|nr:uncharacterized protein DEU56DRAFT_754114 [Suillus clintonianus]KAG2145256.1 hypothetical protein DEU56DRAFT_754114 [Suillus clintonianus]
MIKLTQILEDFPWYDKLASILGTNPVLSLKTVSSQPGMDHAANYFRISCMAGSLYSQGPQSDSTQYGGYASSTHSAAQPQPSPPPAPQYAPPPPAPQYAAPPPAPQYAAPQPAPQPHLAPSGTTYGGAGYSAGTEHPQFNYSTGAQRPYHQHFGTDPPALSVLTPTCPHAPHSLDNDSDLPDTLSLYLQDNNLLLQWELNGPLLEAPE